MMRYGNLTIKIVKSSNPQARDMLRINSAYHSRPTSRDKLYFSGDVNECDLRLTISRILLAVKHDQAKIVIANFFGRPVVSSETEMALRDLALVSVD
jgi:hypothetical protein